MSELKINFVSGKLYKITKNIRSDATNKIYKNKT